MGMSYTDEWQEAVEEALGLIVERRKIAAESKKMFMECGKKRQAAYFRGAEAEARRAALIVERIFADKGITLKPLMPLSP